MPIQIMHNTSGETCPVFVCDHCGEIISNAELGVAVYPAFSDQFASPRFAHRGSCHNAVEHGMPLGGWQPLTYFLHWLINNCSFAPLDQEPYHIGE